MAQAFVDSVRLSIKNGIEEIKTECTPPLEKIPKIKTATDVWKIFTTFIYIPYLPAFTRPGWMKNYIIGPHNFELFEMFYSDIWAGVVVALTLLPQV